MQTTKKRKDAVLFSSFSSPFQFVNTFCKSVTERQKKKDIDNMLHLLFLILVQATGFVTATGARERVTNEIVPVSAEQSSTLDDNTAQYGAELAFDLDLATYSQTTDESSSGEKTWLKLNLGSLHCVEKVILYKSDKSIARSWTCTHNQCTCEGTWCSDFTLTVSTETDPDVATLMCPTLPTCKYLDTVKYERNDGGEMGVFEIAIIGIPVTRDKLIGEITPIKVEQSNTYDGNEPLYAAGRAIDQKFYTCARTKEDLEGIRWIKVTLDKVHCVTKVIWYRAYKQIHTWTCNKDNCSNCEAEGMQSQCSSFTLEVSTEGAVSDLPSISDCRYGDTVKLWKMDGSMTVGELVTIGNKATRDRQAGEITPVRAEHSATYNNDYVKFGVGHAVDGDLETYSTTTAASDGKTWLKVVFDQVHCVQKVLWYYGNANLGLTWTCNDNNCGTCVGNACNDFTLTVSTEGEVSHLSVISDCRYGDIAKLERISGGSTFSVYEIVTIGEHEARERETNEVVPVSAEQSSTLDGNTVLYGAELAIDLDLGTYSQTKDESSSGGKTWLKLNLGSVHCVEKVTVYKSDKTKARSWTCTHNQCTCEGTGCSDFTLTVSTEGAAPDLSPFFDCTSYGNTVKYERNDGKQTGVYEIAIIRKPGIRDKFAGEIIPVRAEHSATLDRDEVNNGVKHAIDMNYNTQSHTGPASDGKWLKITLDGVHCVKQVWIYGSSSNDGPWQTWTCSQNSCSCKGNNFCSSFKVTVSIEGAASGQSLDSDCSYGDSVTYSRTSGNNIGLTEIVIIGYKIGSFKIYWITVTVKLRYFIASEHKIVMPICSYTTKKNFKFHHR
ncbi:hypothetical protein ACHWQZ_G001580 [Mnemiopsis leidyi]